MKTSAKFKQLSAKKRRQLLNLLGESLSASQRTVALGGRRRSLRLAGANACQPTTKQAGGQASKQEPTSKQVWKQVSKQIGENCAKVVSAEAK